MFRIEVNIMTGEIIKIPLAPDNIIIDLEKEEEIKIPESCTKEINNINTNF